ncbi:MAG: DUF4335 domain-containing protein, partial [Phormidesmis sp. CAN_BIN44]|nr:DUF4335 domain-containing protein [Phormidesmis sp. CAN_BIN44]
MTIQRQYSLPNCTLVLEGLADAIAAPQSEMRPVMSLLINAECYLPGQEKPLAGGREFFESLVTAVSLYAQEFLSGIHLPRHTYSDKPSFVKLERLDRIYHRLTVEPSADHTTTTAQKVDLSTVQLFDLVEAIDQFVADTQTLPFWSLNLAPVSKRYAFAREPLAKQAVPAAIGLSSLALAAIAFFMIPAPKVNRPTCLTAGECPTAASPQATGSPALSPSASPSSQASASPSPSQLAEPNLAQLETTLNSTPAITDPQELDRLRQRLYNQINDKWKPQTNLAQDLIYRVGVGKDGAIVGYKPESPGALENVKQTPLLNLLYIPAAGSAPSQEPIGQFKVAFTSQGKLDVSPWETASASPSPTVSESPSPSAASPSPNASPSPTASLSGSSTAPVEITEQSQLEALQPKLYDQLDQNWKGSPPFDKDVLFKVRVKTDGTIAGYEATN